MELARKIWLIILCFLFGLLVIFFLSKELFPSPSPKTVIKEEKNHSILFAGDLMFDRHIRFFAEKYGNDYIFSPTKNLLAASDLVVVNLEGPITDNDSISLGTKPGSANNFIFTFDPSLAETLFEYNIRLVNLGNNHILNFGRSGYDQTKNFLEKADVAFFGFTGIDDSCRYFIKKIGQVRVGFASYNQFINGGYQAVEKDILDLKNKVDLLIVYCHWGNEYQAAANEIIVNQAHQMVDWGADLVIGSHPHVIQPKEIYRGKRIYYSLGNFIFDQYFQPEVKKGQLVKITINDQGEILSFKELFVELQENGQTVEIKE